MFIRTGMVAVALMYATVFSGDSLSPSSSPVGDKTEFTVVQVKKFQFSYKVEADRLVCRVSYPTDGWVAVGFNPVKMMLGANFILGCVSAGKPTVSDEFGASETSHSPDTANGGKYDVSEADIITDKGTTTMSFSIPLNSGDVKDAVLEKGKPIKVIFAAGKKPDLKTGHNALGKTTITLK